MINDSKPYLRHEDYKARYVSNERVHQDAIRDSHESKYFENKNHPEHAKWRESQRQERHHGSDNKQRHD